MDFFTGVAVALLILGMAGSVVPLLPSGLLSLAGVLVYWWHTGFAEPGGLVLLGFIVVGLSAVAADYFGGAIAAGAGGASTRSAAAAGVVGVLLLVLSGPLGMLLGVVGTVVLLEVRRHGDATRGVRAGTFALVGMLGSTIVQLLLTGSMLVGFLAVVLT